VRPVGSDTPRRVDVRIVAATHRALDALVREGKFREDLYFRLRVLTARLPPLRERREDLPLLLVHFLEDARRRAAASPVRAFSPEALRLVGDHPFPGNVRELRHLVESVVVTGQGEIVGADEVREAIAPAGGEGHPIDRAKRDLVPLRELERIYIEWVLERTGGNRTRAAEILGLDPSTLYRREVKGRS
jgi:two-component system response regulator HydG